MRQIFKKRTISGVNIAALSCMLAFGLSACGHPSKKSMAAMTDARNAVSTAINSDVEKYAPETLNEAQTYLDRAESNLKNDYYAAAEVQAQTATNLALKAQNEAKIKIRERAKKLRLKGKHK
jgi:hypothetical protein